MQEKYSSKNLDHLGIVSQICDEIGFVEVIDKFIPPDSQMKLSHGECVKLMVINGLGFTSRPLYLEAQFFSSRPVHRLRLTLDRMFAFGCGPLFASVASGAALRFGISKKFRQKAISREAQRNQQANSRGRKYLFCCR